MLTKALRSKSRLIRNKYILYNSKLPLLFGVVFCKRWYTFAEFFIDIKWVDNKQIAVFTQTDLDKFYKLRNKCQKLWNFIDNYCENFSQCTIFKHFWLLWLTLLMSSVFYTLKVSLCGAYDSRYKDTCDLLIRIRMRIIDIAIIACILWRVSVFNIDLTQ